MKKTSWLLSASLVLCVAAQAQRDDKKPAAAMAPAVADTAKKAAPPAKPGVADKTKGQRKSAGLFTIYQDTTTGSTQLYIRKD